MTYSHLDCWSILLIIYRLSRSYMVRFSDQGRTALDMCASQRQLAGISRALAKHNPLDGSIKFHCHIYITAWLTWTVSQQKPSLYAVLMRFSSHKMHQIQNFPGLCWPLTKGLEPSPPPLSAFWASRVGPSSASH